MFAWASSIVVMVGGQRAVENGAEPVSQPENKQDWGQRSDMCVTLMA